MVQDLLEKEQISAIELKELQKQYKNICILDVRSSMEYNRYHINGALNINIEDLSIEKVKSQLNFKEGDEIILVTYCNAGGRGGRSFHLLKAQNKDYPAIRVKNLQHGINQWIDAGYLIDESLS